MRAIAKRSDTVWLVTEEDEDPPRFARVLDLGQLKLFPPYPTESIMDRGQWEAIEESPDVDEMLKGVDRLDAVVRDPSMTPRTTT